MFKISIPVAQLAAAINFAPKDDVSYYLNGVFFDAKSGNLIATNGHTMYVGRSNTVLVTEGVGEDCILPLAFVKDVAKYHAKLQVVELQIDGRQIISSHHLAVTVEGVYPDWRRVYPEKADGVVYGQIDMQYLAAVVKANRALGVSTACAGQVPVYGTGTDVKDAAVAVLCDGEAHVILMPWREIKREMPKFERFSV